MENENGFHIFIYVPYSLYLDGVGNLLKIVSEIYQPKRAEY